MNIFCERAIPDCETARSSCVLGRGVDAVSFRGPFLVPLSADDKPPERLLLLTFYTCVDTLIQNLYMRLVSYGAPALAIFTDEKSAP
jgi:hypothetical protein